MILWIIGIAYSGNTASYIFYASLLFVSFVYTAVTVEKFSLVIYLIYPEAESKLLSIFHISLLHHSQYELYHSFAESDHKRGSLRSCMGISFHYSKFFAELPAFPYLNFEL